MTLACATLTSSGCGALVRGQAESLADALARAIADHDDPATVRDGVPALLLAIDAVCVSERSPEAALIAGARLYASYATTFVADLPRARRLIDRSRGYAERAVCARDRALCASLRRPFAEAEAALSRTQSGDLPSVYALAVSWALWISLHTDDWNGLADLPKVEAMLSRVTALSDEYDRGGAHMALGILQAQRPASLGGQPEVGRAHFERALAISDGRNLTIHVMYARYYARLVFDRELHDRLLSQVLSASPREPGFTLGNVLAKEEAQKLLASADDYF